MTTRKRIFKLLILILILALACTVGLTAHSAKAESYEDYLTYTDNGGSYTVSGFTYTTADDDEQVNLTIPSTYNGLPVTAIGESAFQNMTFIYSVTIPSSVTDIGKYAFWGCSNLSSVTFMFTEDWYADNGSTEVPISTTYTSSSLISATYLTSTYASYSWFNEDRTAPIGAFYDANDTKHSNAYICTDTVYYKATDANSGLSKMYYFYRSTEVSDTYTITNWTEYDGSAINSSYADGFYYFKAVDNAGNESDIIYMRLDTVHDYDFVRNGNASCEESAYALYKCSICGDEQKVYDTSTAATGHTWVTYNVSEADYDPYQAPTCTEDGYEDQECSVCGITRRVIYYATGHQYNYTTEISWSEFETLTNITYTFTGNTEVLTGFYTFSSKGMLVYTGHGTTIYPVYLSVDGDEVYIELVKNTDTGYYEIDTESSANQNQINYLNTHYGINEDYFLYIEYNKTDNLYYGYYSYTQTSYSKNYNYYTQYTTNGMSYEDFCEEYGDPPDGYMYKVYKCTSCGKYVIVLVEKNLSIIETLTVLLEEYQEYMIQILIITVAIWSVVLGIMYAMARKREEQEKARKMISVYIIGLIVIMVILVILPYILQAIAALVT